jgi:hypothetical protein
MALKPVRAKSISEYLNQIDEPRQSEVRKIHALISKAVPQLKPSIQVGMIGYGTYHAKGLSGEGDWPVIALASNKSSISVYVCGTRESGYIAEKYKEELAGASIGKSCIRFTKTSKIDLKALEKVVRLGAQAMEKAGFRVEAVRA